MKEETRKVVVLDWEDALNRLNMWFKDADLEVKEL